MHKDINTRVWVKQPCHSSRCSSHEPQGCREHQDGLDPSSNGQCETSMVLQAAEAPGGSLFAFPGTHHTPEPAADFHPLQFPPPN